jgi:8-oxo-dGTP diphosphatase
MDKKKTTTIVVFRDNTYDIDILLEIRGEDPSKRLWALPGGYIESGENAKIAAYRELLEETNLNVDKLTEIAIIEHDNYIDHIYSTIVKGDNPITAGTDADEVRWEKLGSVPVLAFDHNNIIKIAYDKMFMHKLSTMNKNLI